VTATEINLQTLHASCVAFNGRAVLILGPSGTGKSALALDLMSRGGSLIADDQVILTRRDDALIASCPKPLTGRIEARGVGLLAAQSGGPAAVRLVVDLAKDSPARMPPKQALALLGCEIDLINGGGLANLAPVIHLILTGALLN